MDGFLNMMQGVAERSGGVHCARDLRAAPFNGILDGRRLASAPHSRVGTGSLSVPDFGQSTIQPLTVPVEVGFFCLHGLGSSLKVPFTPIQETPMGGSRSRRGRAAGTHAKLGFSGP